MAESITQRKLSNDSGEIMRRLDQGESFIITRNGVPVGELTPPVAPPICGYGGSRCPLQECARD